MKKMKKGMRRFRDSVEAYACQCYCACTCKCSCDTVIGSFSRKSSADTNGATKTSIATAAANEI
ncbi:MAG: putative bacteriocin precursor [Lachnospiraceae bacterium]|nr:putative bacteriocin precursor [Lachnospiraceae bacterium]MBD5481184.1 putative bacteriocin precursor [Lachnospiraceae bacterium]